ncbi:MAG: DUF2281 domain-containing protein [Anaerolineae bacterium]|nr:DUF2281 domain-containing protein [Anaerolineae bacterium]
METANIAREITSLPPEAQQQVLDFVAFLKTRYPTIAPVKRSKRIKLTDEPFIGMWQDRDDMQDSGLWVRNLPKNE